jgi:hypothetical protein
MINHLRTDGDFFINNLLVRPYVVSGIDIGISGKENLAKNYVLRTYQTQQLDLGWLGKSK